VPLKCHSGGQKSNLMLNVHANSCKHGNNAWETIPSFTIAKYHFHCLNPFSLILLEEPMDTTWNSVCLLKKIKGTFGFHLDCYPLTLLKLFHIPIQQIFTNTECLLLFFKCAANLRFSKNACKRICKFCLFGEVISPNHVFPSHWSCVATRI